MGDLAAAWYESEVYWKIAVGAAATIGVGAATVWATLRAAYPKRRLTYLLRKNTPRHMFRRQRRLPVQYDGTTLANPRVVELEIVNTGRSDIVDSDFHDEKPIIFRFGVDVVGIVGEDSEPRTRAMPSGHCNGQTFEIRPSLIARRQRASFSLLVDGTRRLHLVPEHSLINVDFREGQRDTPRATIRVPKTIFALMITLIVFLLSYIGARELADTVRK